MKGTVVVAFVALLGYAFAQEAESDSQSRQKRDQLYLTTPTATTEMPVPSTAISLSPQTSISVQHTIVRNKPAYPYPYTESTMQPEGTEDTSYYYTYEDVSEDASKQITSTMTPMTTISTTKAPVKSFWSSQKAILDARRKENAPKFVPTYNKPSTTKEKTIVEFKTREKPKFGLANKSKQYTTTTRMPESTTSKPVELSTKMVKSDIQLNLPIQNLADKDLLKSLKNVNLLPNQIIGRVGEIPVQSNLAQIQTPLRAQSSNINNFRPSKFDNSVRNVQFVDNARQAPPTNTQNQPNPQNNNFNAAALLKTLQTLNQQRSAQGNLNQPIQSNNQPLLNLNQNQQPLLNLNQQQTPLLNTNQNQQPLINLNQQAQAPSNAFISASAPFGNSGRSGELSIQAPSSLLQRLGALGLGGANGNNAVMGRDGGGGYGGGGNGVTLNLGQIPDPLTFFLRLLSLIPRPLLDLNGRVFFGIELGKNAGLVSGTGGGAKPYNG